MKDSLKDFCFISHNLIDRSIIGDTIQMKNKLNTMYSSVLKQLNEETEIHSRRVGLLCEYLAPQMGLDKEIAYKIGLLHDIGKVFIPSRILKKNHGLTKLEREIIDLHSYYSYRLLKEMGEPPIIYMPALFHHGFWKIKLMQPDEPLTDEIIKYVYLIHAADIFEAMTSKRSYHEPMTKNAVISHIQKDIMCTEEIVSLLKKMNVDEVFSTDV